MAVLLRVELACALLLGCGRLGFDPVARVDGSVGADGPGMDAAPTSCVMAWLSGTPSLDPPVRLSELATAGDDRDPFLSHDGLTLYFAGTGDVRVASRPDRDSPFGPALSANDLSSADDEGRVSLTADGLVAFESRSDGTIDHDIWIATRATTTQPFQTGAFDANLASTSQDLDPEISDDGLRLYHSQSPAANVQDLLVASRPDAGAPFTSNLITELNDAEADGDPTLTADERVIVFTRGAGAGAFDLLYATREDRDQPFGSPARVPTVNLAGYDSDAALSDDGCELFFASDRPGPGALGGGGEFDLYRASVH